MEFLENIRWLRRRRFDTEIDIDLVHEHFDSANEFIDRMRAVRGIRFQLVQGSCCVVKIGQMIAQLRRFRRARFR